MSELFSSCQLIERFSGSDSQLAGLVQSWAFVFAAAVFLCFIVGEITRNYSQTDKLWSLMPLIYAWLAVIYYPASSRLWLMALLVSLWGARLSYNFFRKGGYSIIPWKGEEDYRWKIMRDHPALKGRLRFGLFNLFFISFYQHFLILLFSAPLLLAAKYHNTTLTVIDIAAGCLMLFFLVIETVADNQQFRFQKQKRKLPAPGPLFGESLKKGFLSEGLWGYVRHPNFMAEQAIWITFFFFGVSASGSLINWTITGPLLLILLFQGSTRLTERISRSKYPGYADYKKSVPKLLPRLLIKR
ncbi:MAG: DUF1295 domain-containing protein [Bacteroidales bacterium]|nr:DUF1295 domain-containing protein [Bacteroidales bacterium]